MKHLIELKSRYNLPDDTYKSVLTAFDLLQNCYNNGGKVLVCGNGGSASDSEHIVGELMKNFVLKRKLKNDFIEKANKYDDTNQLVNKLEGTLEAISLVSQTSLISAYSNDNDPEFVFAQQVYGYGKKNDVLIALSTSGNSKNVVWAAKTAKILDMKVISITGYKDSQLSLLSDCTIKIQNCETFKIQELTLPIYHALCLELEDYFFNM